MKKISLILLMAGHGSRVGIGKNKIFLKLKRKYIYKYLIDNIYKYFDDIILVCNKDDIDYIKKTIKYKNIRFFIGKNTRSMSSFIGVYNALYNNVIVHDVARCNLNFNHLKLIFDNIDNYDYMTFYRDVTNTIYSEKTPLLRDNLKEILTPQVFLKDVYLKNFSIETDDLTCILKNKDINLLFIEDKNNELIKITTYDDYLLLKEKIK